MYGVKKKRQALGLFFCTTLWASPSPHPERIIPSELEGTVASFAGHVRLAYQGLKLKETLSDSGATPAEETALGESRRWVFRASGVLTIGTAQHPLTCARVRRINELTTAQEFYYEIRLSALEGSCSEPESVRSIELTFTLDDFVANRFKSGKARYFGQTADVLLHPTLLTVPSRAEATWNDGLLSLSGRLGQLPPVSGLVLEVLLRPKGQTSCHRSKFDPTTDPYTSVAVLVQPNGKWGALVPNTGGAVCLRLVGGGWQSPLTAVKLPQPSPPAPPLTTGEK